MHARKLATLAVSIVFVSAAGQAFAVRNPSGPAAEPTTELSAASRVARPDPERQSALDASPAWAAFRGRHGAWRTLWNERTSTPHLAVGPAIPLLGAPRDRDAVDRAIRGFVTRNAALFGDQQVLKTTRLARAGRVWYASYQREVRGIPVLFEDWEFRVSAQGRLMAFGVDAHPFPPVIEATPLLDAYTAREAARQALELPPGSTIENGETLWWLPDERPGGVEHRLVREVSARTSNPPHNWIVLMDARTGAIAWRHDRIRYDVFGSVTGLVHLDLPTGFTSWQPFPLHHVDVSGSATNTDAAGAYFSPANGSVTVSSEIRGPYCDVYRYDAPDASFSAPATAPAQVDVVWDDANSHVAERDGYFHVNLAHAHYKALDPGFIGNDYPMPCVVNISATCNAFWDGNAVNFFVAGGGCPNTATMPDVVYHEYGHGVNDNLYKQAGASFGMLNGALHEGLADVAAAFIQDNPIMGKGIFGPGTSIRTLDNTNRWPENGGGDPHTTGLIVGGAFWDLREAVGLPLAERLFHFCRYGRPDDFDDGISMHEVFVQTLVADDDDGTLSNGTPNDDAIITAFNAHGIGTQRYMSIAHFPLADQFTDGPYTVDAAFHYSGPIGTMDPTSPTVHYSINGSPFGPVPMTYLSGNQYRATISIQPGSIVRYYITAADNYAQVKSDPPNPSDRTHVFLGGATTAQLTQDHESDANWTPGLAGDNAVTGMWEWEEPFGSFIGSTPVQPDDDHTDPGILCYLTQNPFIDTSPGAHDVDGGRTTLTTSLIDATVAGPRPVLEYWRWYTNNLGGSPGSDLWRVLISNNGGATWTSVENTTKSDNSWRRVVFFIHDYVTPTSQIMLRFVAEDAGDPSLVEAAVDDLRLVQFETGVTGVTPSSATPALALAPPTPNPSGLQTRLRFTLSQEGEARLRIYDLSGRRVRMLAAGTRPAGSHDVAWDGRDDVGRLLPSGLYLARLEAFGEERTQRIVRAR